MASAQTSGPCESHPPSCNGGPGVKCNMSVGRHTELKSIIKSCNIQVSVGVKQPNSNKSTSQKRATELSLENIEM